MLNRLKYAKGWRSCEVARFVSQTLSSGTDPGSTMDPGFVASGGQKVFLLARAMEMAASRNPVDIAAALRKVDIVAPDPYLCLAEQYPELKMSASGLTSSGTNQGVQWNADMTAFQTLWPEAIATSKPRVQ